MVTNHQILSQMLSKIFITLRPPKYEKEEHIEFFLLYN